MKRTLQIIYSLFIIVCTCFNAWAATHTVNVNSSSFSPQFLTINEGDQVIFQLVSGTHPIVSDNGHFTNFTLSPSGQTSNSVTFSTAGSYGYHCSAHGSAGSGMYGTITVNAPTSIKESKETYSLQVSPNPFEDEVVLTINQGTKHLTAVKIFDIIGKEVAYIDLKNRSGMVSYRLDFSKLNAGVYFCNVYSESGIVETRKLFRTK